MSRKHCNVDPYYSAIEGEWFCAECAAWLDEPCEHGKFGAQYGYADCDKCAEQNKETL